MIDYDIINKFREQREGFVNSIKGEPTLCSNCHTRYKLDMDEQDSVCVNCGTLYRKGKIYGKPAKGVIYCTKDDRTIIAPVCDIWENTSKHLNRTLQLLKCSYTNLDECILHEIATDNKNSITINFKDML